MDYLLIGLIGFLAFCLKGITGTGTTTVIVACASFLIEPKMAVVLAAFVNIFGGLAMLRLDPVPLHKAFWVPLAAFMLAGSVAGAMALKSIAPDLFEMILGIVFLAVSVSFIRAAPRTQPFSEAPAKASVPDQVAALLAGFCGGFVGVNAPLLVYHFGKILDKRHLRYFLVIIFIPAALTQTVTYQLNGLLSMQTVYYGLAVLPFMLLGIYAGNQLHNKVSDIAFRRILAVFLVFVSLRLIYGAAF